MPSCLNSLKAQSFPPNQIIVVDSGSRETAYLEPYRKDPLIWLHLARKNIGFCQGNNLGISYLRPPCKYVLFLNPDAFLTPSFAEQAIAQMEEPASQQIGALTGVLLGYEGDRQQPTGKIDSTGIFRTWYGRWYDRNQGDAASSLVQGKKEEVPAICGALMFCRWQALQSVALAPSIVMDPAFYMYKEDIDLSLRLRQQGWSLVFNSDLMAYHCRGWKKKRSEIPRLFRLLSARNEMRLHARFKSPCYFYSLLKYVAAKGFDL